MKAGHIDKLYGNLTPKEQANLAFEAIARNDNVELDHIVESVERLNYRDTHWEFRQRGWGLLDLGKYYGLIYWKTRTYLLTVMIKTKMDNNLENQSLLFDLWEKLIAMDVALAEVCAKLNIDVLSVKRVAQCNEEASFVNAEPELVKEYSDLFLGIIE